MLGKRPVVLTLRGTRVRQPKLEPVRGGADHAEPARSQHRAGGRRLLLL